MNVSSKFKLFSVMEDSLPLGSNNIIKPRLTFSKEVIHIISGTQMSHIGVSFVWLGLGKVIHSTE
jgi:hypothetical protein